VFIKDPTRLGGPLFSGIGYVQMERFSGHIIRTKIKVKEMIKED
jgi:hypothetical protein